MSHQIVSNDCHLLEQKDDNFVALQWLSPNRDKLNGCGAHLKELHPQVHITKGGFSLHLVCSCEVETCLSMSCPLLDDNLFIDQSKMIDSIDSQSFYLIIIPQF